MPRAATSVATRTGERASVNSSSARLRADWGSPPWIASALMPAALRFSASRSTPSWVRAKMIVRPGRRGELRGDLQLVAEREGERQVLGRGGLAAGADDLVAGRVLEVATDQGVDLAVQRGREQQTLGVGHRLVEELLDDREEAQVGHEVGLVEHRDDDLGEGGLALADQVLQAARRRDDDVDAAAQLLDLAVHGRAAVDGGELHAGGLAERGQVVVHLLSELTGGHEDQAARGAAAVLHLGADAGEQRQAEGERLARAGGGLAEHVAAGEGVGQSGGLDGERAVDAAPLEGGHQLLGQAQLAEVGPAGASGSRVIQGW